jgi:hypothetical protein
MAATTFSRPPLSSARQASFFDLPRELRDSIYNELFQGASLKVYNPNIRPDLGVTLHFFYKFNGTRKHQNLPRWLFTCKQIWNEAQEQWYRGASCSPCFCSRDYGRTISGSYATAFCELDRAQSFDGPVLSTKNEMDSSYVLWPSTHTSLHTRATNQPHIIVPRVSEHPVSYSVLDCFFKYLRQNTSHPAKHIKLSFTVAELRTESGYSAVDLSHFESLGPRFDRVVFRIACPVTSHRNHTQLHNVAAMYPKIQHEAIRVGKHLVSGVETSGWELRDYLLPMRLPNNDIIPNAFEWHLEVVRRRTQRNGQMQYEGMRYHRIQRGIGPGDGYDYFRPLQTASNGRVISWVCDATGEVM